MKFEKSVITGKVVSVLTSKFDRNVKREDRSDYIHTVPKKNIELDIGGIISERHYGITVASDGRNTTLFKRGTEIRNNSQWTAISTSEIDKINNNLGRDIPELASFIGMNIVIDGVDDFSKLPRGTYLLFSKHKDAFKIGKNNVVLVNHGMVNPCTIAGRGVESGIHEQIASKFPKAAHEIRGLRGWVDKGGQISVGDYIHVLTPTGRT